jgi:hypothetical protein
MLKREKMLTSYAYNYTHSDDFLVLADAIEMAARRNAGAMLTFPLLHPLKKKISFDTNQTLGQAKCVHMRIAAVERQAK